MILAFNINRANKFYGAGHYAQLTYASVTWEVEFVDAWELGEEFEERYCLLVADRNKQNKLDLGTIVRA